MLDDLPSGGIPGSRIDVNPRFRESLVKATNLYSEARGAALHKLYQSLGQINASRDPKEEWAADVEEVAGCCGYFSHCLQAFSADMVVFLDILEMMQEYEARPTRSWGWLRFWRSEEAEEGMARTDSEGMGFGGGGGGCGVLVARWRVLLTGVKRHWLRRIYLGCQGRQI